MDNNNDGRDADPFRTCNTCAHSRPSKVPPAERLAMAAHKQAPPVECCRFPVTVSVIATNQGPATVASRPAMRPDDICGEHETAAELAARRLARPR